LDDAAVLRLLSFRTVTEAAVVDEALRSDVLPALESRRGIVDAFAGRRSANQDGERLVATTWTTPSAMAATFTDGSDLEQLLGVHAGGCRDERIDSLRLAFGFSMERPAPPRLLRLFRGRAKPGALDAYVERVHVGALRDAQTIEGMLGLYVAVDPPDAFVTLSVWADWTSIEEATGSSVRHPVVTRDPGHLVTAVATHFEVIPDSPRSKDVREPRPMTRTR
jgi:hypothetical protein